MSCVLRDRQKGWRKGQKGRETMPPTPCLTSVTIATYQPLLISAIFLDDCGLADFSIVLESFRRWVVIKRSYFEVIWCHILRVLNSTFTQNGFSCEYEKRRWVSQYVWLSNNEILFCNMCKCRISVFYILKLFTWSRKPMNEKSQNQRVAGRESCPWICGLKTYFIHTHWKESKELESIQISLGNGSVEVVLKELPAEQCGLDRLCRRGCRSAPGLWLDIKVPSTHNMQCNEGSGAIASLLEVL